MSQSNDNVPNPQSAPQPSNGNVAPAQPPALAIDDSRVVATYANFCRVMGSPEELIIDFGLNPQPFSPPTAPIPVTQRIVMNLYTAKRTLQALSMTIQRHEAAFGVLETDVQRRVQPGGMRQG